MSHVVNFDVPNTTDAYTHRIGRTGRSGRDGRAFTFVTGEDRAMVDAIERVLGAPIPRRDVPGVTVTTFPGTSDRPARTGARRPARGAAPKNRTRRGGRRGRTRTAGRERVAS